MRRRHFRKVVSFIYLSIYLITRLLAYSLLPSFPTQLDSCLYHPCSLLASSLVDFLLKVSILYCYILFHPLPHLILLPNFIPLPHLHFFILVISLGSPTSHMQSTTHPPSPTPHVVAWPTSIRPTSSSLKIAFRAPQGWFLGDRRIIFPTGSTQPTNACLHRATKPNNQRHPSTPTKNRFKSVTNALVF